MATHIQLTPPLSPKETTKAEIGIAKGAPIDPVLLASVLAFTAAVYATTIRFKFVYDDHGSIVENALVHSWRFVPLYFQGDVWQYLFPNGLANYYRPLNLLWTRFNYALFGLHPAGWHILAIALHLCATSLAFFVARRLTGRPLVAAFAALLFGIHPIHHEVVAWITGATESLWSVLFFLSFLAYLRSREANRVAWLAASCALYAAALLAKEPAILLPAVVCVHAWLYGDRSAEAGCQQSLRARFLHGIQLGLIYVPVAIAYLLVRIHVLHGFSHSSARISAREFVLTLPSVLFFYVKQWLLPIRFAEFYPLSVAQTFDVANVLVPLLGLLLVAAALWFFRRTLGRKELAFSVAWMLLTLLPTLDFAVFPPGDIVHDRYFYLPSFGAALLVAIAVNKLAYGPALFALPRGLVLVTLCVLPPLSYASATASSYWIDDYIMFNHARSIAPDNPTVRNNLAVEVASRGNLEAARPMLSDLLRDSPNNYQANYNFARLSYQVGDLAVAEQYFERAQKINPSVPEPYLQLGLIELKNKKLDAAEMEIRRAIAIRPMEPAFQFALGITLAQRGNCDAARAAFSDALVLNPKFPNAQEQMGKCHP